MKPACRWYSPLKRWPQIRHEPFNPTTSGNPVPSPRKRNGDIDFYHPADHHDDAHHGRAPLRGSSSPGGEIPGATANQTAEPDGRTSGKQTGFTMNPDAIAKLKMFRASRRCLVFGLLGFIPIIGLVFAVVALWTSGTVRQKEKQFWNAARGYRVAGAICAGVTAVFWSGVLIFVLGSVLWH